MNLNTRKLQKVTKMLSLLENPTVKRIVSELDGHTMDQTKLWIKLRNIEQSDLSLKLTQLRRFKLVNASKGQDRRHTYYSLNAEKFNRVNEWIDRLLSYNRELSY